MTSAQRPPNDLPPPSRAGTGPGWPALLAAFVAGALLIGLGWAILGDGDGDDISAETTTTVPTTTTPATSEPEPEEPPYASEEPGSWDVVGVDAGSTLDLRALPGAEADVIGTVPFDSVRLQSTGRISIVDGVLWREIEGPGTTTGWVDASRLAPTAPPEDEAADPGVPAETQAMIDEIRSAAEAGDLERLATLALDGPFTASFGQEVSTPDELMTLWEDAGRDEVLNAILGLIDLPDWYETEAQNEAGDAFAIFVTPRFMHEPANEENRRLLEEALGADYVESAVADGQYLGWRLGITETGNWQFLVAGD